MAAARSSLPSQVVIDLTVSDDEEPEYRRAAREPVFSIAPPRPQPFRTANHLAIRRDGTSSGYASKSNGDERVIVNSLSEGAPPSKSSGPAPVGSGRFPPSTHSFIPQYQNGNSRSYPRPSTQSFPQASQDVPLANTAKRRKTHGEMTSTTPSYRVNNLPTTTSGFQAKEVLQLSQQSSRTLSVSSSSSDSSVVEISPPQNAKNSLREPSHVVPQLQIPKMPIPPPVTDKKSEEKVLDALDTQVFKHIKSSLQGHRKTLSKAERLRIATKATHMIINEPGFLDEFEANGWALPQDYEEKLAVRAKNYVDSLASSSGDDSQQQQTALSASRNIADPGHTRSRTQSLHHVNENVAIENMGPPEIPLVNDIKAFEGVQKPAPQVYRLESPSSEDSSYSTPVPLGNDALDAVVKANADIHRPKRRRIRRKRNTEQEIRRSSRLLTSSAPLEQASNDTVHINLAVQPKVVQHADNRKPNNATVHKVQSLRIFGMDNLRRPYSRFKVLEDIRHGCEVLRNDAGRYLSKAERDLLQESLLHVDFCFEEIQLLHWIISGTNPSTKDDLNSQFISLMSTRELQLEEICKAVKMSGTVGSKGLAWNLLRNRAPEDIRNFLEDAASGYIASIPRLIGAEIRPRSQPAVVGSKSSISSLLREREIFGLAPNRVCQGHSAFTVEIANHIEDTLARRSEWTDCCGDISTITWTGDEAFVCGATAHSDYHNMQYNKPGNLLVGSTFLDTLAAVDGHRIMRPVISRTENVENSLESMRQTQDPWLYTSVVSTAYSEISQCTFTASFDETVKVWKVGKDGSSMDLRGSWKHDGKVNFVVTSEHHNKVATATDVSCNAIRVYKFDERYIPGTPYDTYGGDKAQEQAAEVERTNSWAYFPATIQWGKAESVANLLLVGYSPRSSTGHEVDIPDEKKNSGELCVWNVENGSRVPISSGRTQNVFEVIWHPTLPIFLTATSPCGSFEPETKTQIRLFALNKYGSFLQIKALDCPALDINELTIQPTSQVESYVSASCTDGNTYVWDTAQGDAAIHVLGHGASLDNPLHDLPREVADSGVKFASWGQSTGRFYTGSSDGKVKAWDVRARRGEAYVRTVLSLSGGISTGAFSKDFSKLLVGDATGKVHLLTIDELSDYDDLDDPNSSSTTEVQAPPDTSLNKRADKLEDGSYQSFKRPKVITPHSEPLAPASLRHDVENEQTAQSLGKAYLESGQLILHPDSGIGICQGPNYSDTLLYRYEAHEDDDGTKPLRPEWRKRQQYHLNGQSSHLHIPRLPEAKSSNMELHENNSKLDLNPASLTSEMRESFVREGIDLNFEEQHRFNFEPTPRSSIFKRFSGAQLSSSP